MPLPHSAALELAHTWIALLAPACERLEIAGSVRRGKPEVKDLELVAVPKQGTAQLGLFGDQITTESALNTRLDELERQRWFQKLPPLGQDGSRAWGERYKRFYIETKPRPLASAAVLFAVDLFIVLPPAQFGSILSIRTGPGDYNKALVQFIHHCTPYEQADGRLVQGEQVISTPEEVDYYRVLGLPYPAPNARSVEWLRQIAREKGLCKGSPH